MEKENLTEMDTLIQNYIDADTLKYNLRFEIEQKLLEDRYIGYKFLKLYKGDFTMSGIWKSVRQMLMSRTIQCNCDHITYNLESGEIFHAPVYSDNHNPKFAVVIILDTDLDYFTLPSKLHDYLIDNGIEQIVVDVKLNNEIFALTDDFENVDIFNFSEEDNDSKY